RSWPVPGLDANERMVPGDPSTAEMFGVKPKRVIPNPANPWLNLTIVDASAEEQFGGPLPAPAAFAALVAYREVLANAHCLIGTEQTLYLLQDLQSRSPELVHLVLRHFTLAEITELLRGLVRERIPPRLLPVVLERLARLVVRPVAPQSRPEFVRRGLSDYIRHRFAVGEQARTFFELPPELEAAAAGDDALAGERLRDAVWATLREHGV